MALRSVLTAEDALEIILRELSSQCAVLFSVETAPSAAGHRSSQAMSGPFWRHGRGVAADGAGWHDAPMHRHGPDVARMVIGQTRPPGRHVAATRPRLLGRLVWGRRADWLAGHTPPSSLASQHPVAVCHFGERERDRTETRRDEHQQRVLLLEKMLAWDVSS